MRYSRYLLLLALGVGGCARPRLQPARWRELIVASEGVRLQAPADYQRRNAYGCWERAAAHWGEPGWREFCVGTLDAGRSRSFLQDPRCKWDCWTYASRRVDTLVLAGRRAIVERALASGGINGLRDERQLLVQIVGVDGSALVLHGSTGDEAGYDELLAIAASMRPIPVTRTTPGAPPTSRSPGPTVDSRVAPSAL